MTAPYPFKPGDWVADRGERIGHVKAVYGEPGDILLDIVMFDRDGTKRGRVSPPCGGPRTFEPACAGSEWRRIKEPDFPMALQWVTDGDRVTAKYWAGESLPPAQWTPKKRAARYIIRPADDSLRQALRKIADGHNDARQLAKDTLQRS